MKKETRRAFEYNGECIECNGKYSFYYTLADFGDPPIVLHCKVCNALYWYTQEEEDYLRPLNEQINNMKCAICNNNLKDNLVPTHKCVRCHKCGDVFSLDDDFDRRNTPPDDNQLKTIKVFLLYS